MSGSVSALKNGVLVEEILKMSEKICRVKIFFDKNTFNKNSKTNKNYQEKVIEKYVERLRSTEPEYTFLPSTLYDGTQRSGSGYFWGPFYSYVTFYLLKS